MTFFEPYKSGILLRIKLTPNASFNGFQDLISDSNATPYLRAFLTTAPEKGKANSDLLKLIAKSLKIPKSSLQIICGETDRWKKIYLDIPWSNNIIEQLTALQQRK